jgi:peptidylprolyl isomerase
MAVKTGDKVKLEYTGTLEDGTVFDTSSGKDPLEFEVGSGQVIKGFDDAVMGMEEGQEKEFTLQPTEAYGDHNPEMIKEVPKESMPKEQEPKEGMMLAVGLPNGQQIPAKIVKVADSTVTIDLNHPLAAKTLTFKVKVVAITAA